MNHLEKTFSDMEDTCLSFLHNNESLWIEIEVLKEDVDALDENQKELSDAVKAQKDNDQGVQIAQKKMNLTALAKAFNKANRKLCHQAKKTNNQVLLKSVDIPLSSFLYGEEKEILLRYNTVLKALRENLLVLSLYKFVKADADNLEAQLNRLIAIPGAISIMSGNQKAATRSIKELIDEAHTILDSLDDAVEGMIEDEEFVESWFVARKIKGRHNYKKAEKPLSFKTQ